jgi:hypothetical protein
LLVYHLPNKTLACCNKHHHYLMSLLHRLNVGLLQYSHKSITMDLWLIWQVWEHVSEILTSKKK